MIRVRRLLHLTSCEVLLLWAEEDLAKQVNLQSGNIKAASFQAGVVLKQTENFVMLSF